MPLFCPGVGTNIEVSLSFLVVISSHELQEYLYCIVFYVDFTILLKHFMFDLPGLDSQVLQGFNKVKSLGLKLCTKSAFQAHTAHILGQIREKGIFFSDCQRTGLGRAVEDELDWASVREGLSGTLSLNGSWRVGGKDLSGSYSQLQRRFCCLNTASLTVGKGFLPCCCSVLPMVS